MFGVKEHNGIFTPDLIDDSLTDTLLKTFWKQVRSKDSISLGLLSNNDVKVIKYGKNNIILFNIPRVLPRLHNVIDTPFRLEGSTRIDQKPAHKSIREALVNCIIHTTYGSIARIVVNCYPNEIVFSNPGTMLVSQRQFFTGGQSVCRNQSLQVMFSLLGVGDQAGSGGDVILHGWQEENLRTPYIIESDRPDKVELFMPLESIFSKKIKNELTERFGEGINNLDHNSLTILATAVSEDVTNERLQYIIDAHRADITLLLRELCRNGYLEAYGIGRGTHYKLARFDKANDKAKDKVKDKAGARRKKSQLKNSACIVVHGGRVRKWQGTLVKNFNIFRGELYLKC